MSAEIEQRNQDATCYCGNLDEKVSEELLWEIMLQAGPVVSVHMPKDKVTLEHQSYGFVEFCDEEAADYAMKVMNMVKLFGKPIRVNKASQDKKDVDVGANMFIGNLAADVDEKLLYDTFSAFGGLVSTPKVMRDPDTGNSKGFGFVNYDTFEAADLAIECMNGQFLCNRPVVVQYAFKRGAKGERHGSHAERLLASKNPVRTASRPHTMFSAQPGMAGMPAAPAARPNMVGLRQPPPPTMQRAAYGAPSLPPSMLQHRRPPSMPMGFRPPPPPMGFRPMMPRGMPRGFMRPPPPSFRPPPPPPSFRPPPPPPSFRPPPPPNGGFRPPPPPRGPPRPMMRGPPRPPMLAHMRPPPPPPRGMMPRGPMGMGMARGPPRPMGMMRPPPPPRGPPMGMRPPPPPPSARPMF